MIRDQELRKLARKFVCAKAAEEQAKSTRIVAEKAIASLIEGPDKGQRTETLEDGVKITVKRSLRYKADLQGIKDVFLLVAKQIGESVQPPIKAKTTHTLDEVMYEWYQKNVPEIFKLISQHVEITPAKDAITVKIPKAGEIDG